MIKIDFQPTKTEIDFIPTKQPVIDIEPTNIPGGYRSILKPQEQMQPTPPSVANLPIPAEQPKKYWWEDLPIEEQPLEESVKQRLLSERRQPSRFTQGVEQFAGLPEGTIKERFSKKPSVGQLLGESIFPPLAFKRPEVRTAARIGIEPFQRLLEHLPANVITTLQEKRGWQESPLSALYEVLSSAAAPVSKIKLEPEERRYLKETFLNLYDYYGKKTGVKHTKFDEPMAVIGGLGLRILMPDIFRTISKVGRGYPEVKADIWRGIDRKMAQASEKFTYPKQTPEIARVSKQIGKELVRGIKTHGRVPSGGLHIKITHSQMPWLKLPQTEIAMPLTKGGIIDSATASAKMFANSIRNFAKVNPTQTPQVIESAAKIAPKLGDFVRNIITKIPVIKMTREEMEQPGEVVKRIEEARKIVEAKPLPPIARVKAEVKLPAEGKVEAVIPAELEPLAVEARKFKSVGEFVDNSIKTTKDNIPLVNKGYFKSYPLAQNKIQIIDISELGTLSVPANRDVVIKEIKEDGLIPPIVDTATGEVIDGNHRVAILQELGYKKIPVIEDSDSWVQEGDTYGQIPWNVPEGELAKVKPNQLAKKLVDYSSAKQQLTDIYSQATKGVSPLEEERDVLPDKSIHVALRGEKGMVGYFVYPEKNRASLSVISVKKPYQRTGVATGLIKEVRKRLQSEFGIKELNAKLVTSKEGKALVNKLGIPIEQELIVKEKETAIPTLEEIKTIDIKVDNPLATKRRSEIPLGNTQGSKVAHTKYIEVLFRKSIEAILKLHNKVMDIFARSGTLSRSVNEIKGKNVDYTLNDLDPQVVAHQKFVKQNPVGVWNGYNKARIFILNRLMKATHWPDAVFYSKGNFDKFTSKKGRRAMLEQLPGISNQAFKELSNKVATINSADKSGMFLYLQRNSVRGTGKGQGLFTGKGTLKGAGLSPMKKQGEIRTALESQSKFLNKKNVKFISQDAFDIVEKAGLGQFLLCDPPYYKETGYKVGWTPEQTIKLINALDAAHKRGAEFTYHDTYNEDLVKLWESKGYKVYKVRVPSLVGEARVKDELFVISSAVDPGELGDSFAEGIIGMPPVSKEGVWGEIPGKIVSKAISEVSEANEKEVRKTAKLLQKETVGEALDKAKHIAQRIRAHGGVYKSPETPPELYEMLPKGKEYRSKDPNQPSLDEMAAVLNNEGEMFEGDEDLVMVFETAREAKAMTTDDFIEDAKEMLKGEKGRKILDAIRGKLKPSFITNLIREEIERTVVIIRKRRLALYQKERKGKLIRDIKHQLKVKGLGGTYQDQVRGLNEGLISKYLTVKQKQSLENFRKFIEEKIEEGVPLPIDIGEIKALGKKSIYDMDTTELKDLNQNLHDVIHQGKLMNRLIAYKEAKDFNVVKTKLINNIRRNFPKAKVEVSKKVLTPSERRRGRKKKVAEGLDTIAGTLKKVEAVAEELDGYDPLGIFYQVVFKPSAVAESKEDVLGTKIDNAISDAVTYSGINPFKANSQQDEIEGSNLTKLEQIAVYLNSLNPNNRARLNLGYKWSNEKIDKIVKNLSLKEKKFADRLMKIVGTQRNMLFEIGKKLLGRDIAPVENYWPIITDKELSEEALVRAREDDLFKDIITRSYVKRGFLETRKGGKNAPSINLFQVLTAHLDQTTHFISHALGVRDIQKILFDKDIKGEIIRAVGEGEYKTLTSWLKHIANPKKTAFDWWDKGAGKLRHNTTSAMLGIKVAVGFKQGGSITMTVNRIGVKDTIKGEIAFWKNPIKSQKFIYERSTQMRFRRTKFDRELRDWSKKQLAGESVTKRKFLFALIQTIDKVTTLPSWMGGYIRGYNLYNGNEEQMIEYADKITRRTQPAASPKDLPAVQRGSELWKIFTMFYTHFTNVYNETARTTGMLKKRKIHIHDALVSYWWLLIAPAILALYVAKPRKHTPKEIVKAIIGYGASTIPILRDIVNSMLHTHYQYSMTPVMQLPRELITMVTSKHLSTKARHAALAAGYLLGIPSPQLLISGTGIAELMKGETSNPMRLFLSGYSLERPGEKKGEEVESWLYKEPGKKKEKAKSSWLY